MYISSPFAIFMHYRLFTVFVLSQFIGLSQVKTDSLKQVLLNESDDTAKAITYSKTAKAFESIDIDSAFFYAEKGLTLSREIEYNRGIAENLAALADFHIIRNELDLARDNYLESLDYFDQNEQLFDRAQNKR